MSNCRLFFAVSLLFTATIFTAGAANGVPEAPTAGSGTSQSSPATSKGSTGPADDC